MDSNVPVQKKKTSEESERSLLKFLETSRKPKGIYTHNSLEFGKACEDLSYNHCTSTPHRSETNGIAERAVRRIEEGTSAVFLQAGPDENWWADSMGCYCYPRNMQDRLSEGKTPFEKRLKEPFKGPIIPFGSLVENHPTSTEDQWWIHQFGKQALPGIFFGYVLHAGRIWEGDIPVVDLEELEEMDASETHAKRLNAKEVIMPKSGEMFIIPVADGTGKPFGGHQVLRTSTLVRNQPIRRKITKISWKNLKGIHRHYIFKTHFQMLVKHEMSSGPFQETSKTAFGRLHVPPSRWTKSQTLHAKRRIISCSTEIYWRHQSYSHNLGCNAGKPHRWLLEHRWIKRFVWYMDRFLTIQFIEGKASRRIYVVRR